MKIIRGHLYKPTILTLKTIKFLNESLIAYLLLFAFYEALIFVNCKYTLGSIVSNIICHMDAFISTQTRKKHTSRTVALIINLITHCFWNRCRHVTLSPGSLVDSPRGFWTSPGCVQNLERIHGWFIALNPRPAFTRFDHQSHGGFPLREEEKRGSGHGITYLRCPGACFGLARECLNNHGPLARRPSVPVMERCILLEWLRRFVRSRKWRRKIARLASSILLDGFAGLTAELVIG